MKTNKYIIKFTVTTYTSNPKVIGGKPFPKKETFTKCLTLSNIKDDTTPEHFLKAFMDSILDDCKQRKIKAEEKDIDILIISLIDSY